MTQSIFIVIQPWL